MLVALCPHRAAGRGPLKDEALIDEEDNNDNEPALLGLGLASGEGNQEVGDGESLWLLTRRTLPLATAAAAAGARRPRLLSTRPEAAAAPLIIAAFSLFSSLGVRSSSSSSHGMRCLFFRCWFSSTLLQSATFDEDDAAGSGVNTLDSVSSSLS